jgi:CDGSH-type Zn-finger protein
MEPADGFSVKITGNGPYIVSGEVPIAKEIIVCDEDGESVAWERGEEFHKHPHAALCRCGASHAKPFCDGTHMSIAFDGTETATRTPYDAVADDVDGPTMILRDAVALCADARFCHRAGGAWNMVKTATTPEERATVRTEAELCPSGRYVATDRATGQAYEPDLEPSIGIIEDPQEGVSGPIWVRGGIQVEGADGRLYEVRNRVTLCRCGASQNKPFCDGSHLEIGFTDEK